MQSRRHSAAAATRPLPVARRHPVKIPQLSPHPDTGAVYIVVFYHDLRAMHEIAAGYRLCSAPWIAVIGDDEFEAVFEHYRDRRAVFVHWCQTQLPLVPRDRRATLVPVFYEVVEEDMSGYGAFFRKSLADMIALRGRVDGVLTHTPTSAALLNRLSGIRTAVLPVGRDERVLGRPRWDARKECEAVWYGTSSQDWYGTCVQDRRSRIFAALGATQGFRGRQLSGLYGAELVDELQASKTLLYVKHTEGSFSSTWRLWQVASSSAAMVQEAGDYWPMTRDVCFEVDRTLIENIGELARFVRSLDPAMALERARAAHDQLAPYTITHAIDEIVRATSAWIRR